jgi:hypothetical protein
MQSHFTDFCVNTVVHKRFLRGINFLSQLKQSSESSGMYCRVLNWMSNDVSEVSAASITRALCHSLIALMMEAARTSETSVTFN